MSAQQLTSYLLTTAAFVALANQAQASPTQMVHINTPQCDTLSIPSNVEEIGDFNEFPGTDEDLASQNLGAAPIIPCPATNLPALPEVLIDIRNLTGKAWQEVWYVADQETNITNFDGEANQFPFSPVQEAFRIDAVGVNTPLVSESIRANGIWDIGESWQFVLQDYTNTLGLPPEAITSIGVGSASTTPASGIIDSSGSIIAFTPIPEPATCLLMVMGMGGILMQRRKK